MTLEEKRKWQAFLVRYVMEFGSEPVSTETQRMNTWYSVHPFSVNPNSSLHFKYYPGISEWVGGERALVQLTPLAFELIAADLTPKRRKRTVIDNPKKGDLC